VRPAAKKQSAGCMGVMLMCVGLASAAITLAALVH